MSKISLIKRKTLGLALCSAVEQKNLSKDDLDAVIEIGKFALTRLKESDNASTALNFTGRYLTLFSMEQKNPEKLGTELLTGIDAIFKPKYFPQEYIDKT